MKVLFYRYNSIIEPDILAAFQEIGLDCDTFDLEMTEKNLSPSELILRFGRYLLDHPADFVFSVNFFPYVSEICEKFHLRYISWTVDSPVMELFTSSIQNSWNRTFLFDRAQYDEIHPLNPSCVFHLPLGARTQPKDQLFQRTSAACRKKFSHEIAFVGSLYSEKSPYDKVQTLPPQVRGYLDGIMRAQENVYGYYFIDELLTDDIISTFAECHPSFYRLPESSFLTDRITLSQLYIGNKITAMEREDTFRTLGSHFHVSIYTGSDTSQLPVENLGHAKSLTEMPVIFHESKININTTSKAIRTGLPLRIFDILSAGGFVLSNYQSEIPELFTPGQDLAVYTSMEEMVELCHYYLEHESIRREIAEQGRRTLMERYSMEAVLSRMLLSAFQDAEQGESS